VRRHVSAEVLALHSEGAVSPRKAGRITAHLAACTICSGLEADLLAIRNLLTATQLPPLPEVYAERIQLVIANEAAIRVASSQAPVAPGTAAAITTAAEGAASPAADGPAAEGSGHGVTHGGGESALIPGRPDLPPRRGRKSRRFRMPHWSSPLVLRGLAAAGAVVIVAGAGVLFIRGHATTAGGSGGAAGRSTAEKHAGSVPAPLVSGSNADYSGRNRPVTMNYRLNGKVATARALTTGRDYSRGNMARLVHKDVATAPVFGQNTPSGKQRTQAAGAMFGGVRVVRLTGCLTRLATGRRILVADVARYLGRPATIVVLRSSANARELDVVVVRLTCSRASPDIIAQVTIPPG